MTMPVQMTAQRTKSGPFDGKLKRFCTSLALPVDSTRTGECLRCGECCKFFVRCPFLKYDEFGKSACQAYAVRPPQCRKYPRTRAEQVHGPCGFKFDEDRC